MTSQAILMCIHGGKSQTSVMTDLWVSAKRWMCCARNMLLGRSEWGKLGRVWRLAWYLQKHFLPPPLLQRADLLRKGELVLSVRHCVWFSKPHCSGSSKPILQRGIWGSEQPHSLPKDAMMEEAGVKASFFHSKAIPVHDSTPQITTTF